MENKPFELTPAMIKDPITQARGHDHQWAAMTGSNAIIDDTVRVAITAFVEHLATNPESMRAVADYAMVPTKAAFNQPLQLWKLKRIKDGEQ